jgi:hypothetical protein
MRLKELDLVMTYRLDIDLCKRLDEVRQRFDRVVHAIQKHRLIADYHAMLKQVICGLARNPRDLIGVIDMSVKTDLLALLPALP